jgi:hypothetical protein
MTELIGNEPCHFAGSGSGYLARIDGFLLRR